MEYERINHEQYVTIIKQQQEESPSTINYVWVNASCHVSSKTPLIFLLGLSTVIIQY